MKLPKEVLYLVHATNQDPSTLHELQLFPKCNEREKQHQFPGVFFSLITKDNIQREWIYPGKYVLLFSKDLLQQHNYHMNIDDHNGIISQYNTYFPWQLDTFVKKISTTETYNEVVFHDAISMKHLCQVIIRPSVDDEKEFMNMVYRGGINAFLPRKSLSAKQTKPDMTKKPFFVYTMEHHYSGTQPPRPSSFAWLRMMAKIAHVSPIPRSKKHILLQLEKKGKTLCHARDKQDLQPLMEWNHD